MRRRPREDEQSGTPLRLRRFNPADWPADTDLEAAELWYAARDVWRDEHGEVDADPYPNWPDAPFDARDL